MKHYITSFLLLNFTFLQLFSCAQSADSRMKQNTSDSSKTTAQVPPEFQDTATVGSGCFWCTEAQFELLDGVISATSGFSGGFIKNPAYREVCNGNTGHAEVIQVRYDTRKLTYQDILEAFWASHDPTQLNRQGNDVGTQYRSVIFYHSENQKSIAETLKKRLDESGAYPDPVVTEISEFKAFYPAEDYHQNYFNENGDEPYCQFVVAPKVEKFKKVFKDKLMK